jgi:hypothetical protein
MNIYKDIIILIAATLVMVIIIVFGLSYIIDIKPSLSPQEKRFARFSYEKVKIVERKPAVLANTRSPLEDKEGGGAKDFPSEALADIAPAIRDEKNKGVEKEKNTTQKLSLILIKDRARLAIVNGIVVREGDMTKSGKVQKITKDGIILKDSEGEKWLKIE